MDLDRDFIGYGGHPPDARWPGNARIAINFVMNYEEGSEPSIADGEAATETWFTESHGLNSGVRGRDLAAEGLFEYGSRVGFWRLMRLFQERGLPLTVYGCALALERNPQAAEAIRTSGFDVCSHGWRWIKHYDLSEDEEREHIRRAVESLQRTTGERPHGWYCRYSPSVNTRRLLVEEGGFLYDSDYYGDELPFWKVVQGQPHLVIPYSLTTNDGQFAGSVGTASQWFEFMRDSFDMLYSEGATQPKMMSVGLHMRLIGHPARAAGLARFLDHVMKHEDVWVTRRIDIARHWISEHPFVR
ncbi:polysaccharide deacetylase family protein [Paraburkholderia fungorum]|jgi:allantoinase|uniref:Polysaccharide deacetylase family protein n=1 Tax=Paraburkholderia fungorum TaxID=134537 RepID=A0AAP5V147_9BURK|nr:polysaccharide deacetylase family protein [Paraburkholderia fungorum]MDT8843582.1 polysaccharide deacetylase family protein [Paraburkholderia fungorum]